MVELRKRPAPPPAPPPAKKKATGKAKEKKAEAPATLVTARAVPASAPAPAANTAKSGPPKVGDTITLEGFGGEIATQDERKVTLAQLVEDSSAGVVLFTYPKASTPGCTTQACLFRDSYAPLTATGLSIYGLSNDSPKANTTFKTKQNLPYPLLCDPDQKLIEAIGLKKAPKGTTRGVFVVGKDSKVLAAEPGSPAGTVAVVKSIVENMDSSGVAKGLDNVADKLAAETAAEVADVASAVKLDKSKTSTPVPS